MNKTKILLSLAAIHMGLLRFLLIHINLIYNPHIGLIY